MAITSAFDLPPALRLPNVGELQLVGFQVGSEEFGVDIMRVREIICMRELTRVPTLPGVVEGIVTLRGKVIPVISMRNCFGLPACASDRRRRIVVIETGCGILGFVVDAVLEVLRLPAELIEAPPRVGTAGREYISGIGKIEDRLLLLLDLDRLMVEAAHLLPTPREQMN